MKDTVDRLRARDPEDKFVWLDAAYEIERLRSDNKAWKNTAEDLIRQNHELRNKLKG